MELLQGSLRLKIGRWGQARHLTPPVRTVRHVCSVYPGKRGVAAYSCAISQALPAHRACSVAAARADVQCGSGSRYVHSTSLARCVRSPCVSWLACSLLLFGQAAALPTCGPHVAPCMVAAGGQRSAEPQSCSAGQCSVSRDRFRCESAGVLAPALVALRGGASRGRKEMRIAIDKKAQAAGAHGAKGEAPSAKGVQALAVALYLLTSLSLTFFNKVACPPAPAL